MNLKTGSLLLLVICLGVTAVVFWLLGGLDVAQLQSWLQSWGLWAPGAYILAYVIATLLILPSTALNLTGGALFGPWLGTLWTSLAAILAAVVAFIFSRTIGREAVAQHLGDRWRAMDAEVRRGGCFYMFAARLVPVMPYGIVNFAAGLTSVSFRDYLLGTTLGTVPSVLPFVLLGSSGLQAVRTGEVLPLLGALTLTAVFVIGATWYRRRLPANPKPSTPKNSRF